MRTAILLCLLFAFAVNAQSLAPLLDKDTNEVVANFFGPILSLIPGWKVPPLLHFTSSFSMATYEPWSYYHPTADGLIVDTDAHRRPAAERTVHNKNVAIAYSLYNLISNWYAPFKDPLYNVMIELGLNPDATPTDMTTPEGIGYYCAMQVLDYTLNDGMNRGGDYRRSAHFRPYEDYTGYYPVNPSWLTPGVNINHFDPDRWSPYVDSIRNQGTFNSEVHIAPQTAFRATFNDLNISSFVPDHEPKYWAKDQAAYKAQNQELIDISAGLTTQQKLLAELFDDKIDGFGFPSLFICAKHMCTLDEFVIYDVGRDFVLLDALTVAWWEKRHIDYIRPQTAIPHVFRGQKIRAWAGPGMGTQSFSAEDWKSYIPTDYHTEFPSGTACLCRAFGAYTRKYWNEDWNDMGYPKTWAKGSSKIEPGFLPEQDTTIIINTWHDFEDWCANSRMWAGVHFRTSIEANVDVCHGLGNTTYDTLMKFVAGTAGRKLKRVAKPGTEGTGYGNPVGPASFEMECSAFTTLPSLLIAFVLAFLCL